MDSYSGELLALLDEYEAAVHEAEARRRPGDGLFGFGQKLGDDPCHEVFDRKIAALCARAGAEGCPPGETAEMIALLMGAEDDRPWPECARWAVIAAHRHALPLIPRLAEEERRALLALYGKRYPAYRRLPVQREIVRALQRGR